MLCKTRRLLVLSLLFFFVLQSTDGQNLELRTYFGLSYYMGDLAPLPIRYSVSKGHAAGGIFLGGEVNRFSKIGFTFMRGNISGSDKEANDPRRIVRNLHFTSKIYEIGIKYEFYFNKFFGFLKESPIDIYTSTGLNVFHFNPKAYHQGDWIDLQPLGTEGQGLKAYPDKKQYSRIQMNIPVGVGVSFDFNKKYSFGIEVSPRITFTDYLDDVSDSYINVDDLMHERGAIAASLHDRSSELNYNIASLRNISPGTNRGNPDENDWYLFTSIYFSFQLGK